MLIVLLSFLQPLSFPKPHTCPLECGRELSKFQTHKFQPVLLGHSRRARVCVHGHFAKSCQCAGCSCLPLACSTASCTRVLHSPLSLVKSVSPAGEDEPEDAVSDVDEVPKSKKKKKAKKSSRESRSSKRQRPIREVSLLF